jgi:HK97 family phage major capsid protein
MLEKLLKALKAKLAELDAAHAKVVELETAETVDQDSVKAAKAVHDTLDGEFKALETQVAEAKEHARKAKVLEDVVAMAGVVEPDDTDPAAKSAAKAKDEDAEERELEGFFLDYVCGKAIPDKARDGLRPSSKKILEGEGAKSLRIPKRFLLGMLGANWAKTMYSTNRVDNPSNAENIVPPTDFRAQLQMLATPPPTALDYVTIIRSSVGSVTFPRLVQTDANADLGGMSFSWIAEGYTKPETEPEFDQVEIVPYELAGYTEISHRLLNRSAIDLEALLRTLAGAALRVTLENAIINGSGVAQPLGIVNDAAVRTVARATAGAVAYADLVNLKHALQSYHRGGSRYIMEDEVEQGFENTLDGQGRPLFNASVANGPYDRLIGYPYHISTNSPAIGNAGDIIFGNFAWYFLLMEEEVTMARSDDFRFRNNLAAFRMFLVAGGRPMEPRALAYLEGES